MCCLQLIISGCLLLLEILEVYWNLKTLLEILAISLNLLVLLEIDHKRLAFYCLNTGNGFNNDDVSLNSEQCNVRNVANVVVS